MPYLIQTEQLTKTVRRRNLVTDVSMHVAKGEIYGFLGPNGAGKTTVMKLLTNLWKPTRGTIELFGKKLTPTSYEVLERMGCILEFPTFYEHLTGKENLKLHCEYMGCYRHGSVEEALSLLGLSEAGERPVREFSLGMKQRLGIARAICGRPELLILDEPANGLDPAGMKQIRELLTRLSREYGVTVLISSHILSEIESIADTIGILHQGVLREEISMKEVREKQVGYVELRTPDTRRAAYVLAEKLGISNFRIQDQGNIRIYDRKLPIEEVSKTLVQNSAAVAAIGERTESLEDYYLKITGEVNQTCGN